VTHLQEILCDRYGDAVLAVLFYGSCLRHGDAWDGLVDLYVVVDNYRSAYPTSKLLQFLNKRLPPNVFYLETPFQGRTLRAKYAVLSLQDLQHGVSMQWFHSYIWGRFAQPTALIYTRDATIAKQVFTALAQAVVTLITRALPCLPSSFSAVELWRAALALSYSAELRAEPPERAAQLVEPYGDYYEQVTEAALMAIPYPIHKTANANPAHYESDIAPRVRRSSHWAWKLRRLQGKGLSLLRLIKSLLTFQGGVDYIVWKLERHSGTPITVTPRIRRYPLLFGWKLLWQLYRRRIFR
jgi:hypothetical protein